MTIDDYLRRQKTPQAALQRARLRKERVSAEDELLIADDPISANEYSKEFFSGGQLPDEMHHRLRQIGFLKTLRRGKWDGAQNAAWREYSDRLKAENQRT